MANEFVCLNADKTKIVACDSPDAAYGGYTKDEAEATIKASKEAQKDQKG